MTTDELKKSIAKMKAGLESGSIPDNVRPNVEAALKKAEAQLSDIEKKDAAPRPSAQPEKRKPGRKPVAKRPKAAAAPLDGPPADMDGHALQVGDVVKVKFKKGTIEASIIALQQRKGGGHLVEFEDGGKTVKRMAPPSIVTFVSRPDQITTERKIPKEVVASARKVKRVDCDDPGTNILVTPKETVVLSAPQVADPASGDKILAHPDGTPIAVIEGSEVKKHFKGKGKVGVKKNAQGNAKFDLTPDADPPEEAAKSKDDDDKREYKKVKATKPPKGCTITRDAAKSPKLMLVLEGMRQRWHSGESLDKIVGVFFRKSDNKVLVKVDKYNALDWNVGYKWYTLCPETGNMTQTTAPGAGEASQLMSADAMKEFYRHPHSASCQRVSKALYVECYRNGACDTEKKKRLYAVFASKCAKQELAHSKEYMKWLHKRTAELWKGPGSGQSYASVFKSVAANARAGK